jgi:hypothetical protein
MNRSLIKKTLLFSAGFMAVAHIAFCQPKSGVEAVQAMYEKYNETWFHSVKFGQTATFYKNDTIEKTEIWYESYKYPGMLIIKFEQKDSDDGLLFRNDSLFVFKDGQMIDKKQRIHDLVLLSLDAYVQEPEVTIRKLFYQGYDLNKFSSISHEGTDYYIIGAEENDTTSNQFWIDKENLLFYRMIKTTEKGREVVIFDKYEKYGGGWVEKEVYFYLNGKLTMDEKYFDIETDKATEESNYRPENFKNVGL